MKSMKLSVILDQSSSLALSLYYSLSLISLCPSPRFALRPTLREAFLSNFLLSVSSLSAEFRFGDGKLHKQFPPPAVEPFCPGSVRTPFQFPESILHRYFLPSCHPPLLTLPSLFLSCSCYGTCLAPVQECSNTGRFCPRAAGALAIYSRARGTSVTARICPPDIWSHKPCMNILYILLQKNNQVTIQAIVISLMVQKPMKCSCVKYRVLRPRFSVWESRLLALPWRTGPTKSPVTIWAMCHGKVVFIRRRVRLDAFWPRRETEGEEKNGQPAIKGN